MNSKQPTEEEKYIFTSGKNMKKWEEWCYHKYSALKLKQEVVYHIVSNIALVKPEKARALEDQLIKQAQSGALKEKLSESQLLDILDKLGDGTCTKVTVY